jgi:Xaa-Pro aminopeptidase
MVAPWYIDVHDVGGSRDKNGKDHTLQPGMVFTIEPGIYIANNSVLHLKKMWENQIPKDELENYIEKVKPVIKKYEGIGIRIEDDILVTRDGYEVLSAKVPKEILEIESMMKIKSRLD